eukprot:GDKJ01020527.1.p1 GENE.GDKJ01020527.1~~GDKJ01020527.1.p1  ORF type:complete len:170 (-),score=5.21 GDKJ01020527.1:28-537(-)
MFQARTADEALAIARELCSRHVGLLDDAVSESVRDTALRVILTEAASPGSYSPSKERIFSPEPLKLHNDHSETFRPQLERKGSTLSTTSSRRSGGKGKSLECFYCNEPRSRFCKETGRRHESGLEKAMRQWRRIYRQLSLAASFVSSARLSKLNTCVEEFAIELNLDDI